jgi:hypothetical protein
MYAVGTVSSTNILVRLGDSGGPEATGYVSATMRCQSGNNPVSASSTTGFIQKMTNAGGTIQGFMELRLHDSSANDWVATHNVHDSATLVTFGDGRKSLSGVLDRVQFIPVTGDFDAGDFQIQYFQ